MGHLLGARSVKRPSIPHENSWGGGGGGVHSGNVKYLDLALVWSQSAIHTATNLVPSVRVSLLLKCEGWHWFARVAIRHTAPRPHCATPTTLCCRSPPRVVPQYSVLFHLNIRLIVMTILVGRELVGVRPVECSWPLTQSCQLWNPYVKLASDADAQNSFIGTSRRI